MVSKKIFTVGSAAVLLLSASLIRPLNYDESYYVESARLFLDGYLPYSDFHFHMMPLLPVIYSPFSAFGIWSFVVLKLVSVIFVIMCFFYFYRFLKSNKFEKYLIVLFTVLFFLNSFYLDWSLTIKIYSISSFLFAGFIISFGKYLSGGYKEKHLYTSVIFLTLLLFLKLSFIGNFAVFFIYLFFVIKRLHLPDGAKQFSTSLAIAVIPVLIFLLLYINKTTELFFDLFESNLIMRKYYYPFDVSKILLPLLVPQNLLLLLIILFSGFKYPDFEKFIIINIIVFVLVHSSASILPEYYSTLIPLLVFFAVLRFKRFADKAGKKINPFLRPKLIYIIVFLYTAGIPFGISSLKYLAENRPLAVNIIEMYHLREIIGNIPGKTVLSSWEGYSICSGDEPLMKGYYISSFLREYMAPGEMKLHKISSYDDFKIQILNEIPDIIVYDTINPAHLKGMQDLIESKYLKETEYKYVIIYRRS